MSVLTVEQLEKNYPAFSLGPVSFSLAEGQITGFIGRNGAGKTTTLKSLLGFLHPDGGAVRFFGLDFNGNEKTVKQKIGYISGGFEFYPSRKLKTITAVTRSFYDTWDEKTYRRCLLDFALDENKTPAKLSAGMKVKYALSLALSHGAELLILDEPTSGLDPISRDELLDLFLELKDRGVTILFSTHIITDLEQCADRILYLRQGKLRADEEMKSFIDSYRLVTMTGEEKEKNDLSLLIGCKRRKEGFAALIEAERAKDIFGTVLPADPETIMIHLEKEGEA